MAAPTLKVQPHTQILASENWDDDFEYQQEHNKSEHRHPQRRHVGPTDARKVSIASSAALEDWDADDNSTNVPRSSSATSQAILHQHVEHQTDNWDDDFEDARNSPKKLVNTSSSRRREQESWDNEIGLGEDTEDDSAEFGFAEKEEDRTVTAKSRRAALKRLSSSPTPAPPTIPPPLPTNFLLNLPQQPAQTDPYQHPFPARSPTSSVFSIPTTTFSNQTHDHYYSSTTHLRPTSAFALLPPSPPIHKEREQRRRLRKKSRPKPQGTFELASLRGSSINASETRLGSSRSAGPSNSNRNSCSDDGDAEPSTFEPLPHIMRLRAGTPTDTSSADDRRAATPALTALSVPQTPGKGTALLSRIGSVKKWGVRRKRASTTPSEVIVADDVHRTPRAKSSRASFHVNVPSSRNSMSTPPPSQDPTASKNNLHLHHQNRTGQSSNWFFRASSAGSPHTGAGGRAGGGTSSKGDRGKEEAEGGGIQDYQPASLQRSESSRSRSRTGRMGFLNGGSRTDITRLDISIPLTPSKLVKRKSLGFIQLGKSVVAGKEENEISGCGVNDSPRKERYVGIGLGRATGRGISSEACEENASEHDGSNQRGDGQERKTRRKSFSRFLLDKENESNASSKGEAPEKEKGVSRGFMGSVRRISLVGVGKHKRTKSGSGVLVGIGEGGKVPPLPSSSLLMQYPNPPSTQRLYSLPVTTSSQISLRLRSPYSSGKQTCYQTGSMHDLPSAFAVPTSPSSRAVSGASSQTQASNTSSLLPVSSASSSRSLRAATTGNDKQTPPLLPQRKASSRSRTPDESARPRKLTSSRRSLDIKITNDVSFVTKLSQCGSKKDSDIAPVTQQPISSILPSPSPPLVTSSSAPPPLLPPIELQPPSPPRTITKAAKPPESKPSAILTVFDSNPSKLSPSASSSSVFFTPSSSPQRPAIVPASPNSKANKLHVPLSPANGKPPQLMQQSASLGRATTAGSPHEGPGSNGGSSHPRRNSLGDLKIPARISQAQVGLRRDLGMVKEFANNIEQLKELQRTYDALVVEIQSILDGYLVRYEQHQAQQTPPADLVSPVLADTTSLFPLRPKTRARSNTNRSTCQLETNPEEPVTPAQAAYNELASAFYVINSKYRITWECADLLIELGAGSSSANGNSIDDFSLPSASASAPIVSQLSPVHEPGSAGTNHGRERAITLAGDESIPAQPPLATSSSVPGSAGACRDSLVSSPSSNSPALASPSMSWRTSTGRHDLSQRQLVLLREMLNNARAHANVADTDDVNDSQADAPMPEKPLVPSQIHSQPRILRVAVNNDWKWGDAKNSTVTLPLENGVDMDRKVSTDHKRRSGKLGMSGLRDLLRALKRGGIAEGSAMPLVPALPVHSTTSLSTESSIGSKRLRRHRQPSQRRKPRAGPGPESIRLASENAKGQGEPRTTNSPYGPSFVAAKPSPRRPSLASIFRIGSNKNRSSNNDEAGPVLVRSEGPANGIAAQAASGLGEESSGTEEDWDRMDSASDLDTAANALGVVDGSATVRVGSGRNGKKKKRGGHLEQNSFFAQPAPDIRTLITKRSFGASQTSIRSTEHTSENQFSPLGNGPTTTTRLARLSNVEEHADDASDVHAPRSISQTQPGALVARLHKFGGTHSSTSVNRGGPPVISMPGHVTPPPTADPDKPPLAMTPENIKPLLENAKEVQARLGDCIAELRTLVSRSVEPGIKDVASGVLVIA